ncbi:alginate O-acetyltransferase AlgX-related protein [Paraburkholderia phenazinium]|jgi:alginate O-acetyltransferase complex protein AlgJ|uniref:Alginate O-acetyltransferase complex protein AlgJ n=1 Tax=Paraburkholderia phenazinium TaxID=60549 RepID=A0A1G8FX98_9BURK|nr:twin-arginine translocation pathway signal [Paraburkholderia phenazinium]SDH86764.1 alginate O-acetyltransferase complex protein AlgJ [Paraburkholderia phenazinium]
MIITMTTFDLLNKRASQLLKYALGLAALGAALQAGPVYAASSVIEGQDGWLFPGWERTDKVDRAQIASNIKVIQETKDALAAKHIGLVVMVVPAKAPFYPQRLPASLSLSTEIKSRYADVLAMLAAAGITTFDDKDVLQAVEHDKQTAFYRADYHWTAWAAEASADETAKVIRSKFELPASGSGTVLGEWTNDRRYGDLATNFMSPEDRKRIGRDTYTVRKQPELSDGLLDGAPAQVQVVGNSFVQPYLGYPQKLSNALGQPVGLTWNPGNIGPWKTFLDAVENPAFSQHKLRVIVWQFNEAQLENSSNSADNWDPKGVMPVNIWRSRVVAALSK